MNDLDAAPLGRLLGIAGGLVAKRFQRFLDAQGLSHMGFQVLVAVGAAEGLTQREVAERCYVTPATVTTVVDALEADGLVTRERGTEDRRVIRVALTDAGRLRLAGVREAAADEMVPVFGDLPPDEEAVVRRFLLRTVQRLSGGAR